MLRILTTSALLLGLAGCSGGLSLDPTDWFGPREDEELVSLTPKGGFPPEGDPRAEIAQLTSLRIEQTTGGVIVHAKGVPPRLGYWQAELVPENDGEPENGVLSFSFRVAPPFWATSQGSPQQREINVAEFVSNGTLEGVSRIQVVGANRSLSARR